jgi:hypothetical protein
MKEKDLDSLKQKYLDLFDDDESKFILFCQTLNNDYSTIKIALKELKKKKEDESFVYQNFDQWDHLLDSMKSFFTDDWTKRYYFKRDGKDCFKFKYFVADLLEAKAMKDCPENPQGRYSMLKTELLKYLQNEKPKSISSRTLPQKPSEEEVRDAVKGNIDQIPEDASPEERAEELETIEEMEKEIRPMGIAGMLKQKPYLKD